MKILASNIYTLSDGTTIKSSLKQDELVKRMNRLDNLIVLTEGYNEGPGKSICTKAVRAWNKTDGFTGIIRLTGTERDWLSYLLENNFLSNKDRETIKFYSRM